MYVMETYTFNQLATEAKVESIFSHITYKGLSLYKELAEVQALHI